MCKYFGIFFLLSSDLSAGVEGTDAAKMINITIVGYLLVIISLFFIYVFVAAMSKSIAYFYEYREKREKKMKESQLSVKDSYGKRATPETVAAIMMAMHLNSEMQREEEQAILTIGKIIRPYSPWSSKIYNMRNQPWATLKK